MVEVSYSLLESDLLLSVNYLYLIDKDLIKHPRIYSLNLHGSLLPKYRGRTPHVWAIINGEKETGVTAHLIEEDVDSGDIVKQVTVPIEYNDTGFTILEKFQIIYPTIIFEILENIENNTLKLTPQTNSKATYFGKRTPKDGKINWEWSKERIRNWIRAQARPYPGAFTFLEKSKEKIIINNAEFSNYGFNYETPNGTILYVENSAIFVKTSNGVLKIYGIETIEKIRFREKTRLI